MNKMENKNNKVAKTEQKGMAIDWLSNEEKHIVRGQFFPEKTTDLEMKYCMNVAESLGLNPILKQIYFVPRRSKNDKGTWIDKIEPLAGRDSFLQIAHRSGIYEGMETTTEVVDVPIYLPKTGKNEAIWDQKTDLSATCKVYKKGFERPHIETVYFSEYAQYTKAGELTKFWREKPITMLKKVAESQSLRKAFNITGIIAGDEENMQDIQITVDQNIKNNANKKKIEFSEAEIVEPKKIEPEKVEVKEDVKVETKSDPF